MADTTFEFKGLAKLTDQLRTLAQRAPGAFRDAWRAEMDIEVVEIKERTPWKTHALQDSIRLEGHGAGIRVVAGGGPVDYAVYVHENLDAFHPHGEAKFIERPLQESAPYLADRVATRMRKDL